MKRLVLCLPLLLLAARALGQNGGVKEITRQEYRQAHAIKTKPSNGTVAQKTTDADTIPLTNSINKGIDFGVSLGFNWAFGNLYEAQISPLDNRLKVTGLPSTAFLLSTGVTVPLSSIASALDSSKKHTKGRYYRKLNSDGSESNTGYYVPYGLYAIATVNLVTFNAAADGSAYNQKLDGGLGLGYRLNDNVQVALTLEMISYRQPRQFLLDDYRNALLTDGSGKPVTSISRDDNSYFTDRYLPSVSLKLFYLFAYKP